MKSFRGKNLLRHELIGLNAEVIGSSHMGYEGIHGRIIDETKNESVREDALELVYLLN